MKKRLLLLFSLLFMVAAGTTHAQWEKIILHPRQTIQPSYPTGQSFSLIFTVSWPGLSSGFFYAYTVHSGALPPGLSIRNEVEEGFVEGAPTTTGPYKFVLTRHTDSDGNVFSDEITLNIVAGYQPCYYSMPDVSTPFSGSTPYDLKAQMAAQNMFAENPAITWSSGTPSVATIDNNGLVTLKNIGTTTITVSTPATANHLATTKTFTLTVTSPFCGGDGLSAATAYEICDAQRLADLATLVNAGNSLEGKYFKMTNDIDLTAYLATAGTWASIGTYGSPFKGTFSGGGHRVTGLGYTTDAQNAGLFCWVAAPAVIEDLGVETTAAGIVSTNTWGGILVSANGNQNAGKAGGTIRRCYAKGSIAATNNVGGLAGINSGTIEDCYVVANIASTGATVGGLAGTNTQDATNGGGIIRNCYAAGTLPAGKDLVGSQSGTVANSYIHAGMAATTTEGAVLADADMKKQASFAGWNFTGPWAIDEGVTYPYFGRQKGQAGISDDYAVTNTTYVYNGGAATAFTPGGSIEVRGTATAIALSATAPALGSISIDSPTLTEPGITYTGYIHATSQSGITAHHTVAITRYLDLAAATAADIPAQTYTGIVAPEPVVTDGAATLVKGTHYTLSYLNNTATGTATAVLTGTGAYRGELRKTFEISKAALTVTAKPIEMTFGDNPAQLDLSGAYTITGYVNNETQAVLKTQPQVSIDPSITSATTAGTYADKVVVAGTTADNYAITHVAGTLTIKQDAGTGYITFDAIPAKTYGDAAFTLSGRHSKGKTLTYESGDPSVVSIENTGQQWVATILKAGTVKLFAKFAGDADIAAERAEQSLTIGKAALTVTARNTARTFGKANPDVSTAYDFGTFIKASDKELFTTLPTATIDALQYDAITPAGTYAGAITVSGGAHPSYTLTYIAGTLTIETATGDISFPGLGNKTYGDADFNLSASHEGGNAVSFSSLHPDIIAVSNAAGRWTAKILKAGTATLKASSAAGNSYEAAEQTQEVTVGTASLVIRPDNKTRFYGEANPPLTYEVSGLQYGESKSALGDVKLACPASNASDAGTYDITASGAANTNYTISYNTGTLTVNKATITVTAKPVEMIYGLLPAPADLNGAYTIAGFIAGDGEAVLSAKPVVSLAADITAETAVGTYADKVVVSGTTSKNYNVAHVNGTLTVKQNTGTGFVSFDAIGEKAYGNAPFTLSGRHAMGYAITFESTDPAVISVAGSGQAWTATILKAGTATLKAVFAGNTNHAAETASQDITVKKAALTVTARPQTRSFGLANPVITNAYDFGAFIKAADKDLFTTLPTAQIDPQYDANTPTGTYGGGVTVGGGAHPSYDLTYIPATLTIEAATGDITFSNLGNKTYGDAGFNLTATHAGGNAVSFESLNPGVVSVSQSGGLWTATILKAGTATIKASSAAGNGYVAAEKTQEVTVEQALLYIRPDDKVRDYGSTNPVFTCSVSGLKYDDTEADLGTVTIRCSATASSPAGDYDITASGATNDNYLIYYNTGKLTVNAVDEVLTFVNVFVNLSLTDPDLRQHLGLNPVEGRTEVASGRPFELRIWLDHLTHLSGIVVKLNGKEVAAQTTLRAAPPAPEGGASLRADQIWELIYVYSMTISEDATIDISGVYWNSGKNPTGSSLPNPSEGGTNVYTTPGYIIIEAQAPQPPKGEIRVYTLTGQLVYASPWGRSGGADSGGASTISIPAKAGIYIVVVDNRRWKVMVRN